MTVQVCGQCTTRMAVGLPACPHCGSNDLKPEATSLPSIVVECRTPACPAAGRQARIILRQLTPGFFEAHPALLCRTCGYAAAVVHGWPYDPTPEEGDMAKITVHGGPSNAALDAEQAAGVAENVTAPPPAPPPAPAAETAPTPQPERPAQVDTKAAWLTYAQAVGVTGADGMSKAQLIVAVKAKESGGNAQVAGLQITADAEVTHSDGSTS